MGMPVLGVDSHQSRRFACQVVQTSDDLLFSLVRIFPLVPSSASTDGADDRDYDSAEENGTKLSWSLSHPQSASCSSPTTSSSQSIIDTWVDKATRILNQQWPREEVGSDDDDDCATTSSSSFYYRNLIVHHNPAVSAYYGLACSYVLIRHGTAGRQAAVDGSLSGGEGNVGFLRHDDANCRAPSSDSPASGTAAINEQGSMAAAASSEGDEERTVRGAAELVGHGRLTECFESAGGNASAATYVVIDPNHRQRGYGKILMTLLEQESERLGYHYVYLWTKTAVDFYKQKCGYSECHRVSLKRKCLQALDVKQVQSLEAILLQRQHHRRGDEKNGGSATSRSQSGNSSRGITSNGEQCTKKLETIMLLPPDNNPSTDKQRQDDVWLRKRLVEHVGSIRISTKDRWQEIQDFVSSAMNGQGGRGLPSPSISTSHRWFYRWNADVPWQPQIGPSCGLVALRMVREYYYQREQYQQSAQFGRSDELEDVGTDETTRSTKQSHLGSAPNDEYDKIGVDGVKFPSLLEYAQERGYTQDGEIFDATHLMNLAVDVCDMPNTSCRTFETPLLTAGDVDATIRDGGLWILPYDSNPRTKLPAKLQGRHAHWGIVVGILVCCQAHEAAAAEEEGSASALADGKTGYSQQDAVHMLPSEPNGNAIGQPQRPLSPTQSIYPLDDLKEGVTTNDAACIFLCVQHSLSSQWAIASMDEWMQSNQQLISVDDDRFKLRTEKGGLNLQNKIIRITRNQR